jgi:hypothetical protein
MRRSGRRLQKQRRNKPVATGLYATGLVTVAAGIWYILFYFVVVSYSCRAYVDWWLSSQPGRPILLDAFSLFSITLLFWLVADIARPKPRRHPFALRTVQLALAGSMVLMSVMLSGQLNPQSGDGRVHAFVLDDMTEWPVFSWYLLAGRAWSDHAHFDVDWRDPAFDRYHEAEARYWSRFGNPAVPREFGVVDGQLECEARQGLEAELEQAWALYRLRVEAEQDAAKPSLWELNPLPPAETSVSDS